MRTAGSSTWWRILHSTIKRSRETESKFAHGPARGRGLTRQHYQLSERRARALVGAFDHAVLKSAAGAHGADQADESAGGQAGPRGLAS
jgi:hypothetical protein